jgi:hypothetical protein
MPTDLPSAPGAATLPSGEELLIELETECKRVTDVEAAVAQMRAQFRRDLLLLAQQLIPGAQTIDAWITARYLPAMALPSITTQPSQEDQEVADENEVEPAA